MHLNIAPDLTSQNKLHNLNNSLQPDHSTLKPIHATQPGSLPTPVRIDRLIPYLQGYPQEEIDYLKQGFTEGFRVGFSGNQLSYFGPNSKKLMSALDAARAKIDQEVKAGRISGPYSSPPLPNFRVSPLSIRPKRQEGQYRLLHNLSYPYDDTSTNGGIPQYLKSVHYARVSDAIESIVQVGPNCYMAKCDIFQAFSQIPLHPHDYNLMGFSFEQSYYYHMCLPQGCGSSCKIFERFSTALHWVAQNKLHIPHMHHILDDFIIIAPSYVECKSQLDRFLAFCADVHVPMAPEKTQGPSVVITFLGINLSSIRMEATLPQDKLIQCQQDIKFCLSHKKVTKEKLQSVNGRLNFACSVVLPGRCFLRRMFALTAGLSKPYHTRRLNREVREDLQMWLCFLEHYNGRTFFLQRKLHSDGAVNLCSDASFRGFAATYRDEWIQCPWPAHWTTSYDINFLEFFAVVCAIGMWGSQLKDTTVHFYTDNQAVEAIINNQSSNSPNMISLLRHLVLTCLIHNILLCAKPVRSVDNVLCDRISRFSDTPILLQEYGMKPQPEALPTALHPMTYNPNHYKSLARVFLPPH